MLPADTLTSSFLLGLAEVWGGGRAPSPSPGNGLPGHLLVTYLFAIQGPLSVSPPQVLPDHYTSRSHTRLLSYCIAVFLPMPSLGECYLAYVFPWFLVCLPS